MESENPYEAPSGMSEAPSGTTRPRDSHRTIRVLGMWLNVAGVSLIACSVAVMMLTPVMLAPGVYGVTIGGYVALVGVAFWLNNLAKSHRVR